MAEYVGMDVAKTRLEIAQYPAGAGWAVAYAAAGLAELVTRLDTLAPTLVVLEAPGGDARPLVTALAAAGRPVAVVNPRQVRDFAKALGRLAKTDTLASQVLARFAAAVPPPARPPPAPEAHALTALLARRRQVVGLITMEQNRLPTTTVALRPRVLAHSAFRREELGTLDTALAAAIQAEPAWKERHDLLRSVPGVGPVLATTRLAALPELGALTRREIARLAGVAPLNAASGTLRGKRRGWGGRSSVRAARDLGTLVATRYNAPRRAFYTRLCAAGKPQQLALTACMRTLRTIRNAMLQHQPPWQDNFADHRA